MAATGPRFMSRVQIFVVSIISSWQHETVYDVMTVDAGGALYVFTDGLLVVV